MHAPVIGAGRMEEDLVSLSPFRGRNQLKRPYQTSFLLRDLAVFLFCSSSSPPGHKYAFGACPVFSPRNI